MAAETDVFISYAADTKPVAEYLALALQKEGFSAWAGFKDLEPGERWEEEIGQALDKAQWFLILVGPESRSSPWLEAEWRAALTKAWSDSDKTLVPVLVGGSTSPPFLRHWVPLRLDPDAAPAQWTSQLLQVLQSSGSRVLHRLTGPDRIQREQRLNEIARAAEELRANEAGYEKASPDSHP